MEDFSAYDIEYNDNYLNHYLFIPEIDDLINNKTTDSKTHETIEQNTNNFSDKNDAADFDFDDNSYDDFDYNDNNNDADNNDGTFDFYGTVDKKEFSKSSYKSVTKKSKADLTAFLVLEAQRLPMPPRPKLRKRGVQTNINILINDGNWIELLSDAVEKPVFKSAINNQLIEVISAYENISLIFAPRILVESFRRYRNSAHNKAQEALF